MKKITIFLVLTMMCLVLFTGCGGVSEDADKYIAYSVSMLGIDMEPNEIYDEDIILTMDENGKAVLSLDGEDYKCKWEMDGDVFILSQGSDEFKGTKEGDEISIVNLLDMDLDINFRKEGATPTVDNSEPMGTYLLSGVDMYGMKMSYVDVQNAEMDIALEFKEDGSVEISSGGETLGTPIDYEAQTIEIEGLLCDFVFEDEQITVTSEEEDMTMIMTFTAENSKKWDEIKAEESTIENGFATDDFVAPGYGAETTIPVETLSNPSEWYGIVTISDYEGPYADDMEGEHEARGFLSNDGSGDYFEIHVEDIYEDGNVILSYYAEVHDYTFYPIIGENSWIFDVDLTEDDEIWYTPTLMSGILSASYEYEDDDETFTFTYELAMIEGSDTGAEEDVVEDENSEEPIASEEAESNDQPELTERLTKAQLSEAYNAINELEIEDRKKLTYDEIVANYMHGVEGEVYKSEDDYKSYLWKSQEAETSHVQIDFLLNDDGVWECGNRSTANMGL